MSYRKRWVGGSSGRDKLPIGAVYPAWANSSRSSLAGFSSNSATSTVPVCMAGRWPWPLGRRGWSGRAPPPRARAGSARAPGQGLHGPGLCDPTAPRLQEKGRPAGHAERLNENEPFKAFQGVEKPLDQTPIGEWLRDIGEAGWQAIKPLVLLEAEGPNRMRTLIGHWLLMPVELKRHARQLKACLYALAGWVD
jgi:hypothetical protein